MITLLMDSCKYHSMCRERLISLKIQSEVDFLCFIAMTTLVVVAMVVNCFVHVAMINQYVDSLSKVPVLVTSPFDSNIVSIPLLVYFQLGGMYSV